MAYKVNITPGKKLIDIEDLDETLKEGCQAAARCGTNIYVYGEHGCGKTSVLEYFQAKAPDLFGIDESKVLFLSDLGFVNTIISSIKENSMHLFREKCTQARLIIIDDIERFEGRETTQTELLTLMEMNNKIIIVSGSENPRSLPLNSEIINKVKYYTLMKIDEYDDNEENQNDEAIENHIDSATVGNSSSFKDRTYDYDSITHACSQSS